MSKKPEVPTGQVNLEKLKAMVEAAYLARAWDVTKNANGVELGFRLRANKIDPSIIALADDVKP